MTPHREKLRAAIESQADAQRSLDEARRAAAVATQRWSDANARVGALTRAIEDAEQAPPDSSDRFIAQLAEGLDVLDRPSTALDELRKRLGVAEAESTVWFAARETSEQAIEARQRALDAARHRVQTAAQGVIEGELDVDVLITESEKARQIVLSHSAALFAAMRTLPQDSDKRRAVADYMARPWHTPNAIERASGGERLAEWFEALTRDADAKAG